MTTSLAFRHDLQFQSRVEVLFPVFATTGVTVRLALRHRFKIALLWDDALIVLSLLCSWALWGVWYWTTIHVIGDRETALRPTTPPLLQKLCMAMDLLYGEGMNVVKFAVLLFYMRAFGTNPNDRATRHALWLLIGFIAAYTISRAVETVYLCPPICTGASRTYSVAGWQFAMRAINWLTEFVILLFPIPILWKMMIPTKQKIGIYLCFFLGIITCIASAGRIASSVKLYLAQNAIARQKMALGGVDLSDWFYNYYIPQMSQMTLWSLAELNVGILTATLPAIRSPAISLTRAAVSKIRSSREPVKLSNSQQHSPTNSFTSNSTAIPENQRQVNERVMLMTEHDFV